MFEERGLGRAFWGPLEPLQDLIVGLVNSGHDWAARVDKPTKGYRAWGGRRFSVASSKSINHVVEHSCSRWSLQRQKKVKDSWSPFAAISLRTHSELGAKNSHSDSKAALDAGPTGKGKSEPEDRILISEV